MAGIKYSKTALENFAKTIVAGMSANFENDAKAALGSGELDKYVLRHIVQSGGSKKLRGPMGQYFTKDVEKVIELVGEVIRTTYTLYPQDVREYIYPVQAKALSWEWTEGFKYENPNQKDWPRVFFARVYGYTNSADIQMIKNSLAEENFSGFDPDAQAYLTRLQHEISG